jgi:hypothetical protein
LEQTLGSILCVAVRWCCAAAVPLCKKAKCACYIKLIQEKCVPCFGFGKLCDCMTTGEVEIRFRLRTLSSNLHLAVLWLLLSKEAEMCFQCSFLILTSFMVDVSALPA